MSNFMQICSVGTEFFHAVRGTTWWTCLS